MSGENGTTVQSKTSMLLVEKKEYVLYIKTSTVLVEKMRLLYIVKLGC